MDRPEPPPGIDYLLDTGLNHYGRHEVDKAVDCWRQVLEVEPGHEQALDYLEAAGFQRAEPVSRRERLSLEPAPLRSTPQPVTGQVIDFGEARAQRGEARVASSRPSPNGSAHPDGPEAQRELEMLLGNRRFEEALAHLYAARTRHPGTPAISRGIRLVRERLVALYANRLGNLDAVPTRTVSLDAHGVEGDARQVLILVDGISTFDDILSACPLGRWATLRTLCELRDQGGIVAHHTPGRPGAAAAPISGSTAQARTAAAEPVDKYELLFKRATTAYLKRDFGLAVELFTECCELNSADPRPRYNLEALKRRVGHT